MLAEAQQQAEVVENTIITEKEFKLLKDDKNFQKSLVDVIQFYGTRIQQCIIVGDKTISMKKDLLILIIGKDIHLLLVHYYQ